MKRPERNIVVELFKKSQNISSSAIMEADLIGLHGLLKYTQILGKESIQAVRLKQRGFFRMKPFQKWMPMAAEALDAFDKQSSWILKTMKPGNLKIISHRITWVALKISCMKSRGVRNNFRTQSVLGGKKE